MCVGYDIEPFYYKPLSRREKGDGNFFLASLHLENVDFGINERVEANVNKKFSYFPKRTNSDKYKHLTPIRDAHRVPP